MTAITACCASGLFVFLVQTTPKVIAAIRISDAATVPEWNGRLKLLTNVISNAPNNFKTIGMMKAKTKANTRILAPLAMIKPLRVVFGNFLK
ncbi:MAG: Uncharacterised protein [Flavobacteriales bacterium UBA4585]|nr:MAG: Uncharacterised protein [Flavobacteriales bacterium UBA4585]